MNKDFRKRRESEPIVYDDLSMEENDEIQKHDWSVNLNPRNPYI